MSIIHETCARQNRLPDVLVYRSLGVLLAPACRYSSATPDHLAVHGVQAGEHSQRASVRLQPSDEHASVRLKELGETWESAPAAGPDAGAGADGGAPCLKPKHRHHKDKKHKHRERDAPDAADRCTQAPAWPSAAAPVRCLLGHQLHVLINWV